MKSTVFDHQNVASLDDGDHSVITTSHIDAIEPIVGSKPIAPIVYKGLAHAVNPNSPLAVTLLRGSPSSYSYLATPSVTSADKRIADPQSTGTNAALLTAVQLPSDSSRVVFAGSVRLFSNEFFRASVQSNGQTVQSGNEDLCVAIAKWNFHDKGYLRTSALTHYGTDKPSLRNPHTYRISDNVVCCLCIFMHGRCSYQLFCVCFVQHFSIRIEEYDGDKRAWVPFTRDDVQLEFVMMDPYHRAAMSHDSAGVYSHSFQIPDTFGIFKFRVHYDKPGYSTLDVVEQVGVRPFRHDEYERFLTAAFPYYAGTHFSLSL